MATKFKILERKHRNFEPRRAEIGVEAMELVEDILLLDLAQNVLAEIRDFRNIASDRKVGMEILRSIHTELRTAHRYAKQKLRNEFLAK